MNNPYRILGVNDNATDEEIKVAYKELSKKYHPDNHANSPIADLAQEKMAEINQAYDEIMNMRRGNGSYSQQASYSGSYSSPEYSEIRRLIQSNNITVADQKLDEIDPAIRGAEWFFLKGSVCYCRGWLNEAFTNFTNAVNMDPSNSEYRAALSQMEKNRGGYMNGNPNQQYRTGSTIGGCSTCDLCQGLICADCCCECMGGDLISCC